MSTKALNKVLYGEATAKDVSDACAELMAIERAAKALVKHHVGDVMVERVAHSEEVISAMTTPESQWYHPSVSAVSEACAVLTSIAKEEV